LLIFYARIAFHEPPFRCENEGWGEFDMSIDLYTTEKGGKNTVLHDLNFAKPQYESKHVVTFKNPSAALISILRETGPIPGDENGRKKEDKKRKRAATTVDMEKLAESLPKLDGEQLLHVVQMIHDNKTEETYTKNDVERKSRPFWVTPLWLSHSYTNVYWDLANFCTEGEFHVDLYTLPESLLKMLWDYVTQQLATR
jgi:transcription initiation factor IIF auxiliary subunit